MSLPHRSIGPLARASALLALLAASASSPDASAQSFTWIGPDGSWQTAGFWVPFAPPLFTPPPGNGDTANIVTPDDVTLNADVGRLVELNLANGGQVFTNGFQLSVANATGDATTTVTGNGTPNGFTELIAEPNGIFAAFLGDRVNLESGGELDLERGAIVHIRDRLHVDGASLISGNGTIVFTDELNPVGRRLDLRGSIRPDANNAITLRAESGSIDLDGFVHDDNLVDLTNSRSRLIVDGELADNFTGRIHMGNGAALAMLEPWTLGAAGVDPGGFSLVRFAPGNGNTATIEGDAWSIGVGGGSPANVVVESGTGRVSANAIIRSTANLFVAANSVLDFDGRVDFTGAATIDGPGTFDPGAVNHVMGDVTLSTDVVDFDEGDWNLTQSLTIEAQAIDSFPNNIFENRTIDINAQQIGNNGRLTVNLPVDAAWTLASSSTLNIAAPEGNVVATTIAGSALRMAGPAHLSGNSQFTASIQLLSGGHIALANGASLTLAADSRLAGGRVSGAGELRSASARVVGFGRIDADVRFDAAAELWASGGILQINGDIADLGAVFGVEAGAVLEVNDLSWDAALAGVVRLEGGEITGNGHLQNSGGQIRGHGRLAPQAINNHGIIAAEGGLLHVVAPTNWDGGVLGPNNDGDGELAALLGDMLVSANMTGGPSFVGTLRIGHERRFTYDAPGESVIVFDDATGDNDAGGDVGRLRMTGGRLEADVVVNEGNFAITSQPATIAANRIRFDDLGQTSIESELRLESIGSHIEAQASLSGAGRLVNTEGSTLVIDDQADLDVDLLNAGRLVLGDPTAPADSTAQVEARTFRQAQSGLVQFDVAGSGVADHDLIVATEGSRLDGTLQVELLDGFLPELGDVIPIISSEVGGVAGMFAHEILPSLPGGIGLFPRYQPLLVELVATYAADFDLDGDVDGDDLRHWGAGFGIAVGAIHSQGDADGDGNVDGNDMLIVQSQLGSAFAWSAQAATATTAPEPASWMLFCSALASVMRRRRRSS